MHLCAIFQSYVQKRQMSLQVKATIKTKIFQFKKKYWGKLWNFQKIPEDCAFSLWRGSHLLSCKCSSFSSFLTTLSNLRFQHQTITPCLCHNSLNSPIYNPAVAIQSCLLLVIIHFATNHSRFPHAVQLQRIEKKISISCHAHNGKRFSRCRDASRRKSATNSPESTSSFSRRLPRHGNVTGNTNAVKMLLVPSLEHSFARTHEQNVKEEN